MLFHRHSTLPRCPLMSRCHQYNAFRHTLTNLSRSSTHLHCLLIFRQDSLALSQHHLTHLHHPLTLPCRPYTSSHHHLTLPRRFLMPFNTPVALQCLFVVLHSSTLPFFASSSPFQRLSVVMPSRRCQTPLRRPFKPLQCLPIAI